MRRLLLAVALLGLVAALLPQVPTAEANHLQNGVTFDSLGGNEWWVEVQLGGGYDFYGTPEVRDTDGAWAYMEHPSWAGPGHYALSYHVEAGHLVKFRLTFKGEVLLSCWFTHPAGAEQCDGTENYTARFTPSGTSESIRLKVEATQPSDAAGWQVMGTQGAWNGMNMRLLSSSGTTSTWATDTHVPDGAVLRFESHSNDDWSSYAESGCYRWPAVVAVACPSQDYLSVQPPVSYDGNLTHMEADAYWSPWPDQAKGLSSLDVRFDGGPFHAMRLDRVGAGDGYTFDHYYRYDGAPTRNMTFTQFRGTGADGVAHCDQTTYFWPPRGYPDRVYTDRSAIVMNVGGSTGWVQANVVASTPVVAVEASVNGGPWRSLQLQSWCDWATAMSAPTGTVQFRVYFPDLSFYVSEPFTWNPSGGSTFGADFSSVAGNEWWEQVGVHAFGGTLQKVEARVNGGPWSPLTKQSWGTEMWAGSYHAPQGSVVQFQATSTAGDKVVSACYKWLPTSPAQTTTCPSAPPPPGFDAAFTGVKGNAWWVQADVTATGGTLAGVDARVNCAGSWHPLAKQSWGPNAWAASFSIPAGSKVDLRARSTAGATDLSGGYVWPNATPTSSC